MPKYVIERTVPGAGEMSPEDLRGIAAQSNEVLRRHRRSPIAWANHGLQAHRLPTRPGKTHKNRKRPAKGRPVASTV